MFGRWSCKFMKIYETENRPVGTSLHNERFVTKRIRLGAQNVFVRTFFPTTDESKRLRQMLSVQNRLFFRRNASFVVVTTNQPVKRVGTRWPAQDRAFFWPIVRAAQTHSWAPSVRSPNHRRRRLSIWANYSNLRQVAGCRLALPKTPDGQSISPIKLIWTDFVFRINLDWQ